GAERGTERTGVETAGGAVVELKLGIVWVELDRGLQVVDRGGAVPSFGGEFAEVEQGGAVVGIGLQDGLEQGLGLGVACLLIQGFRGGEINGVRGAGGESREAEQRSKVAQRQRHEPRR